MTDDTPQFTPEQAADAVAQVNAAVVAVRRLVSGCAAAGMHPEALGAACMVLAGEIAEGLALPVEAAEQTALAWFAQGRRNMAGFQVAAVARENGGKLNG